MRRNGLRLLLLLALVGAVSFGCATKAVTSSYRVVVPELALQPLEIPCGIHRCVVVFKSDWERIVRELKGACLANGQTMQECQAVDIFD